MKMKKKSRKGTGKIAKGRMAKSQVWKGRKSKTSGGLMKSALKKNKNGKIVSVKKSNLAMKGKSAKWATAVKASWKKLGLKKFTSLKKSGTYYKTAKAIYTGK